MRLEAPTDYSVFSGQMLCQGLHFLVAQSTPTMRSLVLPHEHKNRWLSPPCSGERRTQTMLFPH